MKFKKTLAILLCLILALCSSAIPVTANEKEIANPVIEGYYADPDIDYFDGKYWIYPTTDGVIDYSDPDGWWGAKTFKAFSSDDMVSWKDNGVILDVAADSAEEAGTNEYGVQIAYSPWSSSHAWAPSIEKVGDMYYFYYVAEVKEEPEYLSKYCYQRPDGSMDIKAIGAAYSSSPTGPFTALDEPIITSKMIYEDFKQKPQVFGGRDLYSNIIDPSIFVDDDGTPYMCLGNTVPYIVELNKDMLSVKTDGLVRRLDGIPKCGAPDGFMEALVVFKRNNTYYYTWSVSGTSDVNYHVSYATSDSLTGKITYQGVMLEKDESQNILGTGHHSILYNPNDNEYYICYHRLCLDDNNKIIEPAGNYREVCINRIDFNAEGKAYSIPTHSGNKVYTFPEESTTEAEATTTTTTTTQPEVTSKQEPSTASTTQQAPSEVTSAKPITTAAKVTKPKSSSLTKVTAGKKQLKATWKKVSGVTGYQLQYSTDKNFKKVTKTVNVKGAKKASTTIKKLSAKKTYYVRIRTYKTTGGKNVYSKWSAKKSVKVK